MKKNTSFKAKYGRECRKAVALAECTDRYQLADAFADAIVGVTGNEIKMDGEEIELVYYNDVGPLSQISDVLESMKISEFSCAITRVIERLYQYTQGLPHIFYVPDLKKYAAKCSFAYPDVRFCSSIKSPLVTEVRVRARVISGSDREEISSLIRKYNEMKNGVC